VKSWAYNQTADIVSQWLTDVKFNQCLTIFRLLVKSYVHQHIFDYVTVTKFNRVVPLINVMRLVLFEISSTQ
jgi:hypothetical protein